MKISYQEIEFRLRSTLDARRLSEVETGLMGTLFGRRFLTSAIKISAIEISAIEIAQQTLCRPFSGLTIQWGLALVKITRSTLALPSAFR